LDVIIAVFKTLLNIIEFVIYNVSLLIIRSSYESSGDENDNAVKSWKETCKVLQSSVRGLVQDAIKRNVSLVLEGVSIMPSKEWIDEFEASGGVACGVLLVVSKEDVHKSLLEKRGFITGNKSAEEQKLKNFERIRLIQDEMVKLATESGWILIEQRIDPDPLDVVNEKLTGSLNEKNQEEADSSISKQLDLDIEDVDVFVEKSILSAEINSGHE
jgi:2-phosphoglycerate kinase